MDLKDELTVKELLIKIGVEPVGIAVELNREIVPKSVHQSMRLNDGDTLEIIKMVGGG